MISYFELSNMQCLIFWSGEKYGLTMWMNNQDLRYLYCRTVCVCPLASSVGPSDRFSPYRHRTFEGRICINVCICMNNMVESEIVKELRRKPQLREGIKLKLWV